MPDPQLNYLILQIFTSFLNETFPKQYSVQNNEHYKHIFLCKNPNFSVKLSDNIQMHFLDLKSIVLIWTMYLGYMVLHSIWVTWSGKLFSHSVHPPRGLPQGDPTPFTPIPKFLSISLKDQKPGKTIHGR